MLRATTTVALLLVWAAAAHADTLKLANGDQINGEIVEWAVDYVVIKHPQLGQIRLALDQLEIDTGELPSPGLFGTRFMRGWNRRINFGLNGKQGNSENTNLTMSANFNYADAFKRWRLTGRYFFSADQDGTSDNNARIDLRRDWLIPESRLFGYTALRYQYDQFESWQHRIVAGGGPGIHLIEKEKHSLDALTGGFFTREFGDRNRTQGDAMAGLEYSWKPGARYTFTLSNQLFIQLVPIAGELRNLTIGEFTILLTEDPTVNLTLGAENEYETDIEPGDQKNDLKYFLTVGLDF